MEGITGPVIIKKKSYGKREMDVYFKSFMVTDAESEQTKMYCYGALLWTAGAVAFEKQWKPFVLTLLVHTGLYFAVPTIKGPSNLYSVLDGVLLSQRKYLQAAPALLVNGYDATIMPTETNLAHAGDTAVGFFIERMGWLN